MIFNMNPSNVHWNKRFWVSLTNFAVFKFPFSGGRGEGMNFEEIPFSFAGLNSRVYRLLQLWPGRSSGDNLQSALWSSEDHRNHGLDGWWPGGYFNTQVRAFVVNPQGQQVCLLSLRDRKNPWLPKTKQTDWQKLIFRLSYSPFPLKRDRL